MIKKESVRSDMKFVPLPLKYTKIFKKNAKTTKKKTW